MQKICIALIVVSLFWVCAAAGAVAPREFVTPLPTPIPTYTPPVTPVMSYLPAATATPEPLDPPTPAEQGARAQVFLTIMRMGR